MIILDSVQIGYERPIVEADAEFKGKNFLLGPNGSGKTTLFRGIAGIAKVFSGRIEIPDKRPKLSLNLEEVLLMLPTLKTYEVMLLRADLLWSSYDKMLEIFLEVLDFSEELLNRRSYKLSGGEKKALVNAIALGSEASNVLLDEPFEGLDPRRKAMLMEFLQESSRTIVLSTHETSFVEKLSGRNVYFMFEGKLFGPIEGYKLANAGVVLGEHEGALLSIKTSKASISIVEGAGKPLTSIYSLDQIYLLG